MQLHKWLLALGPRGCLGGQQRVAVCSQGAFKHRGSPLDVSSCSGHSPGDAQAGGLSGKRWELWATGPRRLVEETGGSMWDSVMEDLDYLLNGV